MPAATEAIAAIRARSRPGLLAALGVDVHFHPDAVTAGGATVLEALLTDLRWRSQFETGTSSGGLTAHPGGDRWRWESRLFAGAYDDVSATERPAYGGLRTVDASHGAAPRFGSAFLRLRPAVLARTTLCFPDSARGPEAVGTVDAAGAVLEARSAIDLDDPLDRYVEAHVHGGLRLDRDVEAVVLDPSFRGTPTEAVAAAGGVEVGWHPGFVLGADALPGLGAYRGPDVAAAAVDIASGGPLTPALLGTARAAGTVDATTAKRVWHLLAAFGRPDRRHPPHHGAGGVSGGGAAPA